MIIRKIEIADAASFWQLQNQLDQETKFMMLEPGERQKDLERTKQFIENLEKNENLLLVAEQGGELVGFIMAACGSYRRTRHCAYIVTGVRKAFQGQGIGTRFFKELDDWAIKHQIRRLELTVMVPNAAAKHLYEKNDFMIEGIKKDSMYVDGKYIDEYYMAKILIGEE